MKQPKRAEITLHQLRIFWSLAHSDTLTRAAKQLGMAQPSMSQQLSRLESVIGARLFERRSGAMTLTGTGNWLLPRAEAVLLRMDDLEEGLAQHREGGRSTLRIAGISSMLRALLPAAIATLGRQHPGLDFDIQDCAPADILDLLRGRQVQIGLLAENSVAADTVDFLRVPLLEDPLLLVVPERLDLDGIDDPETQLSAPDLAILNGAIQFTFGTRHARRIEAWYERALPGHRVFIQCRSFEMALSLVQSGAGVCLAPALSMRSGAGMESGVRLYRANEPARRLVALVGAQDRHRMPYDAMIAALQAAAGEAVMPQIRPPPPFLVARLRAVGA